MSNFRLPILIAIIFAAALSRLIPHPYNFTPITAMALFGGAQFSDKRFAFLVPLAAMFLSDLILGFHSLQLFVYIYFIAVVFVGMWLQNNKTPIAIAGSTLSCSLFFYIVSNFGVWLVDGLYPMTFAGLMRCYAVAIPFFHNWVLGDLFYSALLFGGFALAEKAFPALKLSHPRNF